MNATTKPTSSQQSLSSINIGDSLVEIGTLTTLIGSEIAADLVLGNRGSSGLVWGSIIPFGNSSVIKACAGVALPGWLRHMLGLRTSAADGAIGMDLPLSRSRFAQSMRSIGLQGPLAISCEYDGLETSETSTQRLRQYKDVFAFDRSTSRTFESLTAATSGTPLTVYTLNPDNSFPLRNARFHFLALMLSLVKLVESYYIFTFGGFMLGLLSAVPFMFAFLAGSVAWMLDIISSRKPLSTEGNLDLVMGELPSTRRPGGARNVVLGALKAPRTATMWRIFWAVNALLQIVSLFIYYLLLGHDQVKVVITWVALQAMWVSLRTIIFNMSNTEPILYRRMIKHDFQKLSTPMKSRVLDLVIGVGKHQMHIHPRGIIVYKDDTFSTLQISRFLISPNICETFTLPETIPEGGSLELNMLAIVGDTLLSAAAWMSGSKITAMELYDSCIVVFSIPTVFPNMISAIPAARVFSMSVVTDSENVEPTFVPRGEGGHNHYATQDTSLEWMYWVPCTGGRWMQLKSNEQTALGRVSVQIISDAQLTKTLSAGNLNISLKDVGDVNDVVEFSRKAAKCLYSFLPNTNAEG